MFFNYLFFDDRYRHVKRWLTALIIITLITSIKGHVQSKPHLCLSAPRLEQRLHAALHHRVRRFLGQRETHRQIGGLSEELLEQGGPVQEVRKGSGICCQMILPSPYFYYYEGRRDRGWRAGLGGRAVTHDQIQYAAGEGLHQECEVYDDRSGSDLGDVRDRVPVFLDSGQYCRRSCHRPALYSDQNGSKQLSACEIGPGLSAIHRHHPACRPAPHLLQHCQSAGLLRRDGSSHNLQTIRGCLHCRRNTRKHVEWPLQLLPWKREQYRGWSFHQHLRYYGPVHRQAVHRVKEERDSGAGQTQDHHNAGLPAHHLHPAAGGLFRTLRQPHIRRALRPRSHPTRRHRSKLPELAWNRRLRTVLALTDGLIRMIHPPAVPQEFQRCWYSKDLRYAVKWSCLHLIYIIMKDSHFGEEQRSLTTKFKLHMAKDMVKDFMKTVIYYFKNAKFTLLILGVVWAMYSIECKYLPLVVNETTGVATVPAYTLIKLGANNCLLVKLGQVYRLFTATLLHAGSLQIFYSIVGLLAFCAEMEAVITFKLYAAVFIVGGIQGNMLSGIYNYYYGNQNHIGVGTPTSICAIMGLYIAKLYIDSKKSWTVELSLRRITTMLVYLLIISILPLMDHSAHMGGLISGLLFGLAIIPRDDAEVNSLSKAGTIGLGLYSLLLMGVFA